MRFQFIQAYILAILLIQASFCQIYPLVVLVEFIVGWSEPTEDQLYTGDMNADGNLNVLDAVLLVDVILAE